jgi:hypothetical protein
MAEPVSKIKADCDLGLFHPYRSSANLLHWLVSFAPRVRANSLMLFRETSRLIPSEGPALNAPFSGAEAPCSLCIRYVQL